MSQNIIHTNIDRFLSILFPPQCFNCKKLGDLLCKPCQTALFEQQLRCIHCLEPTNGDICPSCKELPYVHLNGGVWAFDYQKDSVRTAIAEFKYKNNRPLADVFSALMVKKLEPRIQNLEIIVIPIPLHPKKERARGFNQAQLLAQKIAHHLKATFLNALLKEKHTKAQIETKTRQQRLVNIRGSFVCPRPEKILGKNILITDDVYTTGATLNEAARILREAGAQKIIGAVIARG